LSYSSLIIDEGIVIFCAIFVNTIGGVVGIDISDGISLIVDDDGDGCVHSGIPSDPSVGCSVCETYRPKSIQDDTNKKNFLLKYIILNSLSGEKVIKSSILN